jgi:GST-like protein
VTGPLETQLHERHDARDFDTRTQDKLQSANGDTGKP